jgi:outer membrane biosynthesis protein TonB
MRNASLYSLLLALLLLGACTESTKTPPGTPAPGNGAATSQAASGDLQVIPGQSTDLHFAHFEMNFKPVTSGDTVKAIYPFKNASDHTVRISQAAVSCNCMQPSYPQGNIQPGQVGEVKVNFVTEGQKGRHEKIISIILEGNPEPITLRLNGEILPKAE